jgi:hypothetical protein
LAAPIGDPQFQRASTAFSAIQHNDDTAGIAIPTTFALV